MAMNKGGKGWGHLINNKNIQFFKYNISRKQKLFFEFLNKFFLKSIVTV